MVPNRSIIFGALLQWCLRFATCEFELAEKSDDFRASTFHLEPDESYEFPVQSRGFHNLKGEVDTLKDSRRDLSLEGSVETQRLTGNNNNNDESKSDKSYTTMGLQEMMTSDGNPSREILSVANGTLSKGVLSGLLEAIAGYLHTTELVLVTETKNYGACRGLARSLYRRNYRTTCTDYANLQGYFKNLILVPSRKDTGPEISHSLTNVVQRMDSGEIQVTNLIVLLLTSYAHLYSPTLRVNYCVVQLKGEKVEFREVYAFGHPWKAPAEEIIGWWRPAGNSTEGLPYRAEIIAPRDFKGNVLRVAVIESAPHVILTRVEGKLRVRGFLAELMVVLSQQLNFSVEWIEPPDQQHGIPLSNGTWTGLVGYLDQKKADVAVSPLSLTIPRLSVIDFSPAVDHDAVRMVVLKDLELDPMDWGTYIQGFHWSVWLSLIALWVTMSIGLAKVAEPNQDISTYNYLFYFIGAIAQQGCATVPDLFRGRLIFFSFWVGSVLLYASYTACLTSQLAVVPTQLPFHSLTEALTSAGYSLSTKKGTSYFSEMETSRDLGLRLAYAQMMNDETLQANSVTQGIGLLGSRQRKVVFMMDTNSINYVIKRNCSYMWIGPEYFPEYVYLGYRKNLSFANVLSRYINRAADYGITYKLRQRFQYHRMGCNSGGSFHQLTFSKTVLAFAVLGIGTCAGVIALASEFFVKWRNSQKLLFSVSKNGVLVKLKLRRHSTLYKQVSQVRFINNK